MTIDTKDILNSILNSISRIDYIKTEEIPNIDLYMDQVTTFMEEHLAASKRHPEDKILTKTMINNYAKNRLLPPPTKKKNSKEHLLTRKFKKSQESFSDINREESEFLQKFAFICMLSFDVYVKKQVIEQLIDHMSDPTN